MTMKFSTYAGKSVSLQEISDLVSTDYEYEVFVGTDSQVKRKIEKVQYSTCIVLYRKGKGGRIFISRMVEPYSKSLQQRLQKEAWKSLEVSFELQHLLPANAEIIIDLDLARKCLIKGAQWPLLANKQGRNGDLREKDNNITLNGPR